jgi:hypothetical protein
MIGGLLASQCDRFNSRSDLTPARQGQLNSTFDAPPRAPPEYEVVWQQVRRARDILLRGGPFAWDSCAVAVRQALESWERVEPGDRDRRPGSTHATKRSRLYGLRKELRYYVDYAAHDQQVDEPAWTREDALLALTTLCALLAARKPAGVSQKSCAPSGSHGLSVLRV